ncbi:MAG: hypothetical protein KC733_05095 [Candidatus Omnitrophica bacterium]|nr:hypothetical protein [Candidatus Omnitrophota bacterium]
MNGIFEKAQAAATKLIVKSALNPALWFTGTITPVCFIAAWFFKNSDVRDSFIYAGFVPIGLVVLAYIFFMFFDRDRLHSEEFQLKKIDLIRSKTTGIISEATVVGTIPSELGKEE